MKKIFQNKSKFCFPDFHMHLFISEFFPETFIFSLSYRSLGPLGDSHSPNNQAPSGWAPRQHQIATPLISEKGKEQVLNWME